MHKKSVASIYAYPTYNGRWKTELEMYTIQTDLRFSGRGNWIYFNFLRKPYTWNWLCDTQCCHNIYRTLQVITVLYFLQEEMSTAYSAATLLLDELPYIVFKAVVFRVQLIIGWTVRQLVSTAIVLSWPHLVLIHLSCKWENPLRSTEPSALGLSLISWT
jgi:hypothetical protein